jgi:ribosomal protein S18 acetylase RimI-like enzyme
MKLREADEGDAAAVADLWTVAYADPGPEGRQEPYALQEYFAVAASARVTVAVDGADEVVAVGALFAPGAPGRAVARAGEAEFARLAVAAAARRRGIGRKLVLTATAQARQFGAESVVLWSRPCQTDAHALYESLGWRRVPERDEDDRDGRRLVFVLDL